MTAHSDASTPRVVIIGGGVGGLATAALLGRGGAQVTLLEGRDQFGGRAGQLEVDGFRFDTGPSWYLMGEALEQFYALTGRRVDDELSLVDLGPRYRVFYEPHGDEPSAALDVTADPATNDATFAAVEPGADKRLRKYAKDAGESYHLALQRFLYTTFENPLRVVNGRVLRKSWRLATLLTRSLQAKIASTIKDARLQKVLGFHAVFLGSAPRRAPALYSLMSHLDLVDGVRYLEGGMYSFTESLVRVARAEGAELRPGSPVAAIEVDAESRLATGVRLADGSVVPADIVVSGADLHHTETQLLEPRWRTHPERAWKRRSPGVSAPLAFMSVKGDLPELAHHTLLFADDWDANFGAVVGDRNLRPPLPASLYVSRTTATDRSAAPAGHENLVMLVPFPTDTRNAADPAEARDLVDEYLGQIESWIGVHDLRGRVTVHKILAPADFANELNTWRGSALGLEHTLAQSAMFRPGNASRKVANLLYVGSSTVPGIGLPMCVISAELIVKRLMGDTSVGPTPHELEPGFLAKSRRKGVLGRLARGEEQA